MSKVLPVEILSEKILGPRCVIVMDAMDAVSSLLWKHVWYVLISSFIDGRNQDQTCSKGAQAVTGTLVPVQ